MPKKKDRVALYPTIDPQSSLGFFRDGGAFSSNAILEVYSDQRSYVTQRPGLSVINDPSVWFPVEGRGRGIYYWEQQSALIIVIDNTVFNLAGTALGTISSGNHPVWMSQIGNSVILLDEQNNEGWVINSALTVSPITDEDFPATLAGGGAVLNGLAYVLDENGVIYNSGLLDPTSWSALDFIEAEREPDAGVYITKFLDHIVVFGSRTIEFLYDAGNPVGSPLNRRDDVSYRIGAVSPISVYNSGDVVYFISADVSGSLKAQSLQGFQLAPISNPQIDRYMEARFRSSNVEILLSGSHVFGHLFIYLTFAISQDNNWLVQENLTYDAVTNYVSNFSTVFPGIDSFSVISWTERQGPSIDFSFGLLASGHVIRWSGSVVPVDTNVADPYVADGYVVQGYVSDLTGLPPPILYIEDDYIEDDYWDPAADTIQLPNIEMVIRTELWDASALGPVAEHNKFIHKLELVGAQLANFTEENVPINIRWTDDNYNTYSEFRPVRIGTKQRLTRCGMTQRRAFEVSYSGVNRIRWERLDITFGVSSYA